MLIDLLEAGFASLQDYIGVHVLTCLIPAFFLAGAMVTFVNREAILVYLGESAGTVKTFTLAGAASFFLAACSCTVIPVASGLYFSGAGIGAAFIVLWVAPAANVLALVYTGSVIGGDMVVARIIAALAMAVVVGFVMKASFGGERRVSNALPQHEQRPRLIAARELVLIGLLALNLLLPNYLGASGPYSLKIFVWAASGVVLVIYAITMIERQRLSQWLRETWWFVKIIFPLLLIGVFIVGIIGKVLPEEWIQQWLGGSSLSASFLATLIGAVSYFATMTEAPFVDTLMNLGMGKGPALALLLTGPGVSLPNWLAIAKIFGVRQALVYVLTIVVLGTCVGWFAGRFVF